MTQYPTDWPKTGDLDLKIHDLPHESSSTEWWYVNSHFETAENHKLSIFAAFFRIVRGRDEVTKEHKFAHSVIWALSDIDGKNYYSESLVDKCAPELGLERIKQGQGSKDHRLNRAASEIFEHGRMPAPDIIFESEPFVAKNKLELDFDSRQFKRQDDGTYHLSLYNPKTHVGCDLVFHPKKLAVRHGQDGVVKGLQGEDMFYYFIPRCDVTGTVDFKGKKHQIKEGQGWYDHEFGGLISEEAAKKGISNEAVHNIAWNWTGIQLKNGTEITAFLTGRVDTGEAIGKDLIIVDPDGKRHYHSDMVFEPVKWWRSTRTFFDYPICWHLEVPSAEINLTVQGVFDDQEFMTLISKHALWEGLCEVYGTIHEKNVTGVGYVERSGYESVKDLDDFFSSVGDEVRKSVDSIIPFTPSYDQVRDLIASKERNYYMEGVDINQFVRAMIKPLREITDRHGKSWRSYAPLVCCDCVGGDSRKYVHWLAMPELIHTGSLIIDDVEDKSTKRRGGPACHLIYGEPIAINTGNAAFFLGQRLLISNGVSNTQKLRLYDYYFEALRAAHAGQAFDIDGVYDLMPNAIETGDSKQLEERLYAISRLKTAVPASCLARMGAVVGGGSEVQIEALGMFFESVGIAFQIIDDVLNLRGFKGNLKTRGEDIIAGKITYPIAKAFSMLPAEDRKWVFEVIQSKEKVEQQVYDVVDKLEECGALESSVDIAKNIVDEAWKNLDPVIQDSFAKIMLRAFGWYVLERIY